MNPLSSEAIRAIYHERELVFAEELSNTTRAINYTSYGRILIALLFISTIYFGYNATQFLYLLFPLTVAFVVLMRRHNALFNKKSLLEQLVELNVSEQAGLKHQHTSSQMEIGSRTLIMGSVMTLIFLAKLLCFNTLIVAALWWVKRRLRKVLRAKSLRKDKSLISRKLSER